MSRPSSSTIMLFTMRASSEMETPSPCLQTATLKRNTKKSRKGKLSLCCKNTEASDSRMIHCKYLGQSIIVWSKAQSEKCNTAQKLSDWNTHTNTATGYQHYYTTTCQSKCSITWHHILSHSAVFGLSVQSCVSAKCYLLIYCITCYAAAQALQPWQRWGFLLVGWDTFEEYYWTVQWDSHCSL